MSHRELDPSGTMFTTPGRNVPIAIDLPERRSMRCITPLCAMITWWRMGSTMSCSGSCFQCAIPAPEESSAMRNGWVLSTRAISPSAGRRSGVERASGWAAGGGGKPLCEGLRMSAVFPVMVWLLLISSGFRSVVRICTERRVFYAPRLRCVFPEPGMLCPILLQAGPRFRERTAGGRGGEVLVRKGRRPPHGRHIDVAIGHACGAGWPDFEADKPCPIPRHILRTEGPDDRGAARP